MIGGVANLSIIITAIDKASGTFKKMGANLAATGAKMKSVGKGMTMGLTLPLVGVGVAAGKLSIDFEKSMTNISTLINTTTEDMGAMKKEILDLSKRTPVALDDLTSSLYDIRSAGISAEEAMDVLESSAKLATAGLGTTKEATDILTSAINAFGLEEKDAEKIANTFFLAVKTGKTTVAELAQGFGQVAPLANELGIEFEELMANTAAMTTSGLKASIAYTQQKAVMSNLLKPTTEMQEAMDKVKMSSVKASIASDGFTETLRRLYDAAEGDEQIIAKMFGSVEGLNAVMMLMGETGDVAWETMGNMYTNATALNEAFKKQKETVAASAQIMKNKLNAAMIILGDQILPLIVPLVEKFTDFIAVLSDKFSKLSPTIQKAIIIVLALVAALGPLLMVLGMIIPALPILAAVFSPIGLVIMALIIVIGLLVKIGWTLYKDWDLIVKGYKIMWDEMVEKVKNIIKPFTDALNKIAEFFKFWASVIWEAVVTVFTNIRDFLWGMVLIWADILRPIWEPLIKATNIMSDIVMKVIGEMKEKISKIWQWIKESTGVIWGAISEIMEKITIGLKEDIVKALETLQEKWEEAWQAIANFLDIIWEQVKKPLGWILDKFEKIIEAGKKVIQWVKEAAISTAKIGAGEISLQHGGIVMGPTHALIGEAGPEAVIPLGKGFAGVGAGVGNITINIYGNTFMADEEGAEEIGDMIIEKLKLQRRL